MATVAETPDSGTMKRADKDMAAVLKTLSDLGAKPIDSRSVAEARAQPTPADAVKAVLKERGKDPVALMGTMKVSKKDVTYPTAGGTQPIRLYTPEGAGAGPLPVIVYYHGGGWVIADIDTYEASAMALAKKSNAIVASVEYRRAPENKFPAAHQDSFAAYQWVLANAGQFGGDPSRVEPKSVDQGVVGVTSDVLGVGGQDLCRTRLEGVCHGMQRRVLQRSAGRRQLRRGFTRARGY